MVAELLIKCTLRNKQGVLSGYYLGQVHVRDRLLTTTNIQAMNNADGLYESLAWIVRFPGNAKLCWDLWFLVGMRIFW